MRDPLRAVSYSATSEALPRKWVPVVRSWTGAAVSQIAEVRLAVPSSVPFTYTRTFDPS